MKRTKQILVTVVIVMLNFSSLVHGDTWTAAKRLTVTIADCEYPAIAVNGSNIYVVWQYSTAGTSEINFKRSTNGGVYLERDQAANEIHNECYGSRHSR